MREKSVGNFTFIAKISAVKDRRAVCKKQQNGYEKKEKHTWRDKLLKQKGNKQIKQKVSS